MTKTLEIGDRVMWESPLGLLWMGEVVAVEGEKASVFWDGKWGAGPMQDASHLTVYAKNGAQQ